MSSITTSSNISTRFDPLHPKHQVDPKFNPNKADSWPLPGESSSDILAHNAIRAELDSLNTALKSLCQSRLPLEKGHLQALQESLVKGHLERIAQRFQTENESVIPFRQKRFHYPEKQLSDQATLHEMIKSLQQGIISLKPGDTFSQEMFQRWTGYQQLTRTFLLEKETTVFALTRVYFTAQELKNLETQLFMRSHRQDMGALIHFLGVDEFRKEYMVREGIPSFMWTMDFKSRHQSYCTKFVDNVASLTKAAATTKANKSRTTTTATKKNKAISNNKKFFGVAVR